MTSSVALRALAVAVRHAHLPKRLINRIACCPQTRVAHRPEGIVLENDGIQHHWLFPGFTYELAYDGTGWRVTCSSWPASSHIYRLSRGRRDFVNALPTLDGTIELTHGQHYVIKELNRAWMVALG